VNNSLNEDQSQKVSIEKNSLLNLDQLDNGQNEEAKNSIDVDNNVLSKQQEKNLENETVQNNKPDEDEDELQTDRNEIKTNIKEISSVDAGKSVDKKMTEEEFLENVKLVKPSISKENELRN
jgi:hypothetical protein